MAVCHTTQYGRGRENPNRYDGLAGRDATDVSGFLPFVSLGAGGGGVSAWLDRNALDADKLRHDRLLAFDRETQFDGLPDTFHRRVE